MKQLTIRGVPDEVEREIRRAARQKGISLNKAALALLESVSSAPRRKKMKTSLHHDLDHLCGIWNRKDAEEMEKRLALHRKIDEALWKQ